MSYNPYGGKYTYGGSLKHYRTAGSKNGVSTDPNYKPIGKKAVGRIIGKRPDGTPIYSYGPQSAGQKDRNTQALQRAVSGQQNRSRNSEALRQRVGTKTALDSRAINNNAGVVARREQRNRINAATATNAGSRGISSREEAQRKGSRSNANQYGNTFGNRLGRTGEAVRAKGNKAVRDANSFIQNTVKNAPETITKAAKDTRNIFQRGASAIGDWFNERRKDLGNAGRSVGNWLSDRGRDIGRAAKSAYEAISNSDERRAYEKAQANFRKNPNAENRKARDTAKKAYDSHLLTRLERGVRGAPGNISRAARSARDAISNQDERRAYEQAREAYRTNRTAENRKEYDNAKKAYQDHALTKAERTAKNVASDVGRAARNVSRDARNTTRRVSKDAANITKNIGAYASTKAKQASDIISSLPASARTSFDDLISNIKSGKTKAEVDAAMIELQNNVNMLANGPASMPSDNYLDKVAPTKKKKK